MRTATSWLCRILILVGTAYFTGHVIAAQIATPKEGGYAPITARYADAQKHLLHLSDTASANGLTGRDLQKLVKIVDRESDFDPEAVNINDNKSTDYGLFQINDRTWDATARRLGLDYKNNVEDNIELAVYIYKTSPRHEYEWTSMRKK